MNWLILLSFVSDDVYLADIDWAYLLSIGVLVRLTVHVGVQGNTHLREWPLIRCCRYCFISLSLLASVYYGLLAVQSLIFVCVLIDCLYIWAYVQTDLM